MAEEFLIVKIMTYEGVPMQNDLVKIVHAGWNPDFRMNQTSSNGTMLLKETPGRYNLGWIPSGTRDYNHNYTANFDYPGGFMMVEIFIEPTRFYNNKPPWITENPEPGVEVVITTDHAELVEKDYRFADKLPTTGKLSIKYIRQVDERPAWGVQIEMSETRGGEVLERKNTDAFGVVGYEGITVRKNYYFSSTDRQYVDKTVALKTTTTGDWTYETVYLVTTGEMEEQEEMAHEDEVYNIYATFVEEDAELGISTPLSGVRGYITFKDGPHSPTYSDEKTTGNDGQVVFSTSKIGDMNVFGQLPGRSADKNFNVTDRDFDIEVTISFTPDEDEEFVGPPEPDQTVDEMLDDLNSDADSLAWLNHPPSELVSMLAIEFGKSLSQEQHAFGITVVEKILNRQNDHLMQYGKDDEYFRLFSWTGVKENFLIIWEIDAGFPFPKLKSGDDPGGDGADGTNGEPPEPPVKKKEYNLIIATLFVVFLVFAFKTIMKGKVKQ